MVGFLVQVLHYSRIFYFFRLFLNITLKTYDNLLSFTNERTILPIIIQFIRFFGTDFPFVGKIFLLHIGYFFLKNFGCLVPPVILNLHGEFTTFRTLNCTKSVMDEFIMLKKHSDHPMDLLGSRTKSSMLTQCYKIKFFGNFQ